MGLLKCEDCGKMVSDQREACFNCGRPIQNQNNYFDDNKEREPQEAIPEALLKNLSPGFLIAMFFLLGLALSISYSSSQINSKPKPTLAPGTIDTTENSARITITPIKWYEGGNLHQKTLREWTQATRENKLATCADFAVSHPRIKSIVSNRNSLDAAKPYAIQLLTAIDEVAKDKNLGKQRVSEIAAASMVLMKW